MTVAQDNPTPPPSTALLDRQRGIDGLWLGLMWLVPALILRPFQDAPFIDDWVYAWPVEHLLHTGSLRILDISSSLTYTQVLWGTLFCLPFGFSFTALRISTWVAAWLGIWGLYLLLRELNVSRRDALIGAAALAFYPIFLMLSVTFMTDVPLLSCLIWASVAFVHGQRRRRDGWLIAAIVLSALASGIRPVAIVLPVAMGLALVIVPWGRQRIRFLWPVAAIGFFFWLLRWHEGHTEHVADLTWFGGTPANRLHDVKQYAIPMLPGMLRQSFTFVAGTMGLALLPLAAGWMTFTRGQLFRAGAVLVLLGEIVLFLNVNGDSHHPPMMDGATWQLGELGCAHQLVANNEPFVPPPWLRWMITVITLTSGAILLGAMCRWPYSPGEAFLLWCVVGHLLLVALLWLIFDRYALVFTPLVVALLLSARPLARPRVAIGLVCLWAVVGMVGLRDHLAYSHALWGAVDSLQREGAPASQIDAGYVVNGWLQYAHPENARRNEEGEVSVPMVNGGGLLHYQISNAPSKEWPTLRTVPYSSWLSGRGQLYILDRSAGAANSSP